MSDKLEAADVLDFIRQTVPTVYDAVRDARRPVTQKDVERFEIAMSALAQVSRIFENARQDIERLDKGAA